jgi:hypothetical protein
MAQHAEPAERIGGEHAKADQRVAAGRGQAFPELAELVGQRQQVGGAFALRAVLEPFESGPGEQAVDVDALGAEAALDALHHVRGGQILHAGARVLADAPRAGLMLGLLTYLSSGPGSVPGCVFLLCVHAKCNAAENDPVFFKKRSFDPQHAGWKRVLARLRRAGVMP